MHRHGAKSMEVVALGEGTPHELNTRPLWQGMVGKPPQHMACEASAPPSCSNPDLCHVSMAEGTGLASILLDLVGSTRIGSGGVGKAMVGSLQGLSR